MFSLYKTACETEGVSDEFDEGAKLLELEQLRNHEHSAKVQAQEASSLKLGSHNEGEMLLHVDMIKNNFFEGKPSDEADQINEGMVQTFMMFAKPLATVQTEQTSSKVKNTPKNSSALHEERKAVATMLNQKFE